MNIFRWFLRLISQFVAVFLPGVSYDQLPTASPSHIANEQVRWDLERIKERLEHLTGTRLVIGFRRPSEFIDSKTNPSCESLKPVSYRPENGFLIYYLARPDVDHGHGPIVRHTPRKREATWVLCVSPDGIHVHLELFDVTIETALVEILKTDATVVCPYVMTVHEVYPKGLLVGSVVWMKYMLYRQPTVPIERGEKKTTAP